MRVPFVTLAFGLLAAVGASQLPEFAQQYRQRLGGVIDELDRQVKQFQADADANKLTWDAATQRLRMNPDDLAQKHGSHMVEAKARLLRLESQQTSFTEAGPFYRILVMLRDFDPQTAQRALEHYEIAVPGTSEGLVTTVVGFFFGGGLLRLLGAPFRRRPSQPSQPVYAMANAAPASREDMSRAESIRLRERINKTSLPRPGLSRDRRET